MKEKGACTLGLVVIIWSGIFLNGPPTYSKPIVKDEGQAKLMQEINSGQKSNQLTVNEAKKLRKDLARVARKKAKMLGKTNRRLRDEDKAEIIGNLNDISNNIHKLELEKRIKSR